MELPAETITEAITAHWGERCPDFEPDCPCCKAWAQYDHLLGATERAAKIAEDEPELPGEPTETELWQMHTAGPVMNARAACRATKRSIAAAIRSQP